MLGARQQVESFMVDFHPLVWKPWEVGFYRPLSPKALGLIDQTVDRDLDKLIHELDLP